MKGPCQNSRRRFFKDMLGEAVAWCDQIAGRPQLRVSDLRDLSRERLSSLVPGIFPGTRIIALDDTICARGPVAAEVVELFARNPVDLFIFNRFNGQTPLGQIGLEVCGAFGLDDAEGFGRVKALFLRLVRLKVGGPCNQGM